MASVLNILGLSVAFAVFTVIMMQVRWEYQYGKTDVASDSIFRLEKYVDQIGFYHTTHHISTHDKLINSTANVDKYARISGGRMMDFYVLKDGQKQFFELKSICFHNDVSEIFDIKMRQGEFKSILVPGNAIINRSTASLLFGDADPVGRKIFTKDEEFNVVGVSEDQPGNATIKNGVWVYQNEDPNYGIYQLFVKVKDPSKIGEMVDAFEKNENKNSTKAKSDYPSIRLINVGDIYFDQLANATDEKHGDLRTTNVLLAIAILIIFIALVNFVNFYTSLAPVRVKGLNTRVVFGSSRAALRWQIIFEGMVLSVFAFLISLLFIDIFNSISLKSLILIDSTTLTDNIGIVCVCGAMSLVVGFVAGLFPAFYCTKFEPAVALKGSAMGSQKGQKLRMTLVGMQYVISIVLIICAIFVKLQHEAMLNAPLGFDKANLLRVNVGERNALKIMEQLKAIPTVQKTAIYRGTFGTGKGDNGEMYCFPNGDTVHFWQYFVDHNFMSTIGIPIIEGENFSEKTANFFDVIFDNVDTQYDVIIGKSVAKTHNVKVGDLLVVPRGLPARVVGICGDFIATSVVEQQTPVVFTKSQGGALLIRINPENTPKSIDEINKEIKKIIPENSPTVVFYDQHVGMMYEKEKKLGTLITLFSMIAIVISLMGVFGLMVFETQYRRKEIGIRKVFGSTVREILLMFNKKFAIITIVCFVLATPIAYFAIDKWLDGFAYKTPMFWWVFAVGGVIVLLITATIVTLQAYKNATENPIKSIKTE